MCDLLVMTYYVPYSNTYKNYPYEIQRCDFVRYCILDRYGGLYADMDYFCNRSFTEAFRKYTNSFYLVRVQDGVLKGRVGLSLMYSSVKNHPFWKAMLINMKLNSECPIYYSRHMIILYTTGPEIINRVYQKYRMRYRLKTLPYKLFHPFGMDEDILHHKGINKEIYAVHANKGMWEKNDSKFIITVYKEWKICIAIIAILLIPQIIMMYHNTSPQDEQK